MQPIGRAPDRPIARPSQGVRLCNRQVQLVARTYTIFLAALR